jgi:hypothetical protein
MPSIPGLLFDYRNALPIGSMALDSALSRPLTRAEIDCGLSAAEIQRRVQAALDKRAAHIAGELESMFPSIRHIGNDTSPQSPRGVLAMDAAHQTKASTDVGRMFPDSVRIRQAW